MLIFSTPRTVDFAQKICRATGVALGALSVNRFSDGEIFAAYDECLPGKDVFIVSSMNAPVNESLMELLVSIDAARRVTTGRIIAVIPYFGYARQDRKTKARSSITAKLVADMLVSAGANYILTADVHSRAMEGFFNVPFDNICAISLFIDDIERHRVNKDLVVVSPDIGGVVRARAFAKKLGVELVVIDKRREKPNAVEVTGIIGEVRGRHCIVVDDLIDTGGTVCKAAEKLKEKGAASVRVYATHGVLSGNAVETLARSASDEIVLTDTIAHTEVLPPKIRTLSLAPLFAETMTKIHNNQSIADLSVF